MAQTGAVAKGFFEIARSSFTAGATCRGIAGSTKPDQRFGLVRGKLLLADIMLTMEGRVATITLNRPEKRNAITLAMWAKLPALVAEARANPQTRLLVITGSNGHFSAGADIAELPDAYGEPARALASQTIMLEAMAAVETSALPTLARIEGNCIGGGCGLALACDWRWATPEAVFAVTPARLGLTYGISDTRRLVQAVGLARSRQILFTGARTDAANALRWGLIDELHRSDTIEGAITALADQLAGSASSSIAACKAIIARVASGAHEDDATSQAMFAAAFAGADFKEGFGAFTQKRPAVFQW